jgi:hypothetical protein
MRNMEMQWLLEAIVLITTAYPILEKQSYCLEKAIQTLCSLLKMPI